MIFKTTLNIITERFLHVKQLLPQFVIQPLWSQIFTLRPQIRVSTFPGRLKADKDCSHSEGSVCSGPTCRRHQVQFTRNTQKAHLRSRNEWNNNFCLLKWICTTVNECEQTILGVLWLGREQLVPRPQSLLFVLGQTRETWVEWKYNEEVSWLNSSAVIVRNNSPSFL